ncbi:MAG: 3-deoxy-7-phosphoheptulonate synthase, partial [Acholeplasmataceae bacterium]
LTIGGGSFQIIAGPCAVEDKETMIEIAENLRDNNVKMIRGGVFKPRTSPYSFQGLGIAGLKMLKEVADKYNLVVVTEVISPEQVDLIKDYVDIYQVGTRNMQNYPLLKVLGAQKKPVIIKRGMSATIEEWLLSAEYVLEGGNPNVILCERGIRTFERYTRNTLDITAVLAVKELSHLPVMVDPSHASGKYEMIEKLSLASLVVGADGIMVEIHPHPEKAYSDGAQSLKLHKFNSLVKEVNRLKKVL